MHSTVRQYHIISSYHSNGKEKKTEFALYNSCKKTTYMNEPIDKLPIRCYMLSKYIYKMNNKGNFIFKMTIDIVPEDSFLKFDDETDCGDFVR